MRTLREHVACIMGVLMLTGASALGGEEKLSNTRIASCLVKITVDPAVMPLNPGTVESLIGSSAVSGQAGRKVLGLDPDAAAHIQESISIEWLLEGGQYADAPASGFTGKQEDPAKEMHRQMEEMYGKEYAKMMQGAPSKKAGSPGDSQPDDGTPAKPQSRRDGSGSSVRYGTVRGGSGMGGMTSGYGVMGGGTGGPMMSGAGGGMGGGMGGYGGGMGMGGMYGMRAGPSRAENLQHSVTIRLSVQLQEEVKPAAEEFLRVVVMNLRQNLQYAFEGYESELQDVISRSERQQESAAEELGKLLGAGADTSMVPVDIGDLMARRRELATIIQDTEINMASMNARRQAIEQQIAFTRKELDEKQRGDEITDTLAKIVQNNQELLGNLEKQLQAGRVPEAEVIKAQENVMKARIELARRREELAKSGGGDQLGRFSKELSQMAIDAAESRARLEMLQQQLKQTQEQLDQIARFDPKAAAIRAARETLDAAERRASELRRRLADLELNPPMVTSLGAN